MAAVGIYTPNRDFWLILRLRTDQLALLVAKPGGTGLSGCPPRGESQRMPTLSNETLRALVNAAHKRRLLAVAHVLSEQKAPTTQLPQEVMDLVHRVLNMYSELSLRRASAERVRAAEAI